MSKEIENDVKKMSIKESLSHTSSEYELEGKIPTGKAIILGMQHVLAMFVGNLTPILVIGGACSLGDAGLMVPVIQNAMLVAGLVTLVQLWTIGTYRRKAAVRNGNELGLYRSHERCCRLNGRRSGRIWCHPRSKPARRNI